MRRENVRWPQRRPRRTGSVADIAFEIGRNESAGAHVFSEPQQTVAQFHGAAGGIETVAIIVVARDVRENRLEMRILRQARLSIARCPDMSRRTFLRPPSDQGWRAIQFRVSSPSLTS